MPPTERPAPRFAAEPPQEALPYGRWAHRLTDAFYGACATIDGEGEDLGEPGDVTWYPDRTYGGRTYVPATAPTSAGHELFGYVSFVPGDEDGAEPSAFEAGADFTAETAERHPEWRIDLSDEPIGSWRGEGGHTATIALVWGRPLVAGAAIATAELADLTVDQCALVEERFTLIAPDDYRHDLLEIRVYDRGGRELARESLYEEGDEPEGEDESAA